MSGFQNPLYPILFVLIAVAFVGQAQSTRQNRTQMIAAAFVVAALFRGGGLALNNVVVLNPNMVPLMYALPLGGIIFSTILIRRNEMAEKPGLSISDRVEMALGGAWTHGSPSRWSGASPASRRVGGDHRIMTLLQLYIARRFISMVAVTFVLCAGLIFMIDFVEMLREAGKKRPGRPADPGVADSSASAGLYRDHTDVCCACWKHIIAAHAGAAQ